MTTLERIEQIQAPEIEPPGSIRTSFRLWSLAAVVGLVPPVAGVVLGVLWLRRITDAHARGPAIEFTKMSAFFLIVSVVLLSVMAFMASRMRVGKRWARTGLVVATALGLVWAVQSFAGVFGSGTLLDTIRLASASAFVALTLLATLCMFLRSARMYFD